VLGKRMSNEVKNGHCSLCSRPLGSGGRLSILRFERTSDLEAIRTGDDPVSSRVRGGVIWRLLKRERATFPLPSLRID